MIDAINNGNLNIIFTKYNFKNDIKYYRGAYYFMNNINDKKAKILMKNNNKLIFLQPYLGNCYYFLHKYNKSKFYLKYLVNRNLISNIRNLLADIYRNNKKYIKYLIYYIYFNKKCSYTFLSKSHISIPNIKYFITIILKK